MHTTRGSSALPEDYAPSARCVTTSTKQSDYPRRNTSAATYACRPQNASAEKYSCGSRARSPAESFDPSAPGDSLAGPDPLKSPCPFESGRNNAGRLENTRPPPFKHTIHRAQSGTVAIPNGATNVFTGDSPVQREAALSGWNSFDKEVL